MPTSFEWRFDALVSRSGHAAVCALMQVVDDILCHPILLEGLSSIVAMERSSFKSRSGDGYVWNRGRHEDQGNYRYTMLYQMLGRLAGHKNMALDTKFVELGEIYQSLRLKAPCTTTSLSMKGDVIEVLLAECREDGPSVQQTVAEERRRFNALMLKFGACCEHIFKLVFRSDDGPSKLRQTPPPDSLVKVLFFAYGVIAAAGTSAYARKLDDFKLAANSAERSCGLLQS